MLHEDICAALDDYLLSALSRTHSEQFLAHLPGCATCMAAVDAQARFDQHLRQAWIERVNVPADLVSRIQRKRQSKPWRRAIYAAAACAAAIGLSSWLAPPLQPPRAKDTRPDPPSAVARAAKPVLLNVTSSNPVMVVPQPVGSADVTVVWLYPGAGAASRRAALGERNDK